MKALITLKIKMYLHLYKCMYMHTTEGRFKLDIERKFLAVRVLGDWNRLPRGCPIPGSVQGQVEWSSEQPVL